MRKIGLIALMFVLILGVGAASAVTVPYDCGQFVRGKGAPVVQTVEEIPGIPGTIGTLRVINGADDDTLEKVSSSIIMFNGANVLSQEDFNQNVSELTVEVNLQEANTLSVEVRGKPGGTIKIELLQEIDAEAAKIVGPEGNIIEILNTDSGLFSMKIIIPPNSVDKETIISIHEIDGLPSPPTGTIDVSTSFSLKPDGLVFKANEPVKAYIPYKFDSTIANEHIKVMQYDHEIKDWIKIGRSSIDKLNNTIEINLFHFSDYQVQKTNVDLTQDASTNFMIEKDHFVNQAAQNAKDCKGIAAYTKWYYELIGHGLSCAYSENTARSIASDADLYLYFFYTMPYSQDHEDVAKTLWENLNDKGKPILLGMRGENILDKGHMVLVYKYEYDEEKNSGIFFLQDSATTYIDRPKSLKFNLETKEFKTYQYYYKKFLVVKSNQEGADSHMRSIYVNYASEMLSDSDYDLVRDDCDNCPNDSNPDQLDSNGDGVGNKCENYYGEICNDGFDNDWDGDIDCDDSDCSGSADCFLNGDIDILNPYEGVEEFNSVNLSWLFYSNCFNCDYSFKIEYSTDGKKTWHTINDSYDEYATYFEDISAFLYDTNLPVLTTEGMIECYIKVTLNNDPSIYGISGMFVLHYDNSL